MDLPAALWKHAVWLAPLVVVAAVSLLVVSIRGLVRANRIRQILSVPLLAEQTVEFPEAGTVHLAVEGPLFTGRFAGTAFAMTSVATGEAVTSAPILFRTKSSGFSTVRLEVRAFHIPRPGAYRLRIDGLKDGADAPDGRILFARPFGTRLVLHILAIVLSGILTIGSVVAFGIRMAGR